MTCGPLQCNEETCQLTHVMCSQAITAASSYNNCRLSPARCPLHHIIQCSIICPQVSHTSSSASNPSFSRHFPYPSPSLQVFVRQLSLCVQFSEFRRHCPNALLQRRHGHTP